MTIDPAIKEEAMQMIRDGVSGREVVRRMGIDRWEISKWRKDAGLSGVNTNAKYSKNFKQIAIQLSTKTTVAEAARRLGVPYQTLSRWRKKAGINAHKPAYSDELKEEMLGMISEGYTNNDVHEILGIPRTRISKWRKEAGMSGGGAIYSEEAKNYVLDLLRERMGVKRIRRITGIGTGTITKWRDQLEKEGYL